MDGPPVAERILLTGGTGMVGRNVLDLAAERGIEIAAPGRHESDLTDAAAVRRTIDAIEPDVVIHAAGRVGGIKANMDRPAAFLLDNLDMGRNVVMAAMVASSLAISSLSTSADLPRTRSEIPAPETTSPETRR